MTSQMRYYARDLQNHAKIFYIASSASELRLQISAS